MTTPIQEIANRILVMSAQTTWFQDRDKLMRKKRLITLEKLKVLTYAERMNLLNGFLNDAKSVKNKIEDNMNPGDKGEWERLQQESYAIERLILWVEDLIKRFKARK